MKLLQSEVLIVPGRSAQYPQGAGLAEGQAVPGGAVVRLTNTTPRENAFKVRVRCGDPYWQEDWVHPVPLPPPPGQDNAPTGKPDQRGPQGRWIKVYVPRDGSRDILLRFQVPQAPDARAGRYPFVVEIETQILGTEAGQSRRSRATELAGTAYIAPFYKWSVDLSPPQQTVGVVKHSDEFAVVVTNEGNDWLYCDVEVPRPTNMLLEAPTLRVSVPPPEPGELLPMGVGEQARVGTQRCVPLRATSQLRQIGGMQTLQPIALTATRVDAPSVILPTGNPGSGSVVAQETAEKEQVPGNRGLMYRPPVPAALSRLFDRTGNAFQAAIAMFVGFGILTLAVLVAEENYRFNGIKAEPLEIDTITNPGQLVRFEGPKLDGAKITLGGDQVTPARDYSGLDRYKVEVPKTLDGKVAVLKAQRSLRYLPFLDPFLPHYESKTEIKVNVPKEKSKEGGKDNPDGPTPKPDEAQQAAAAAAQKKLDEDNKAKEKQKALAKKKADDLEKQKQKQRNNKKPTDKTPTGPLPPPPGPTPPPPDRGPTDKMLLTRLNEVMHAPSREMFRLAHTLIATASGITQNDAGDETAWAIQGFLEVTIGQTDQGEKALNTALKLKSDNYLTQAGLGLLAYQQAMQAQGVARTDKLNVAVGNLQTSVGIYSHSAMLHLLLGRAYMQLGLNEQALQQATGALEAEEPKLAAAYQLQGNIYTRMGNTTEAQAAYESARKLDADLPNLAEDINKLHGN